MADWMSQQISNPDQVDEEEAAEQTKNATEEPDTERTDFEKQLRTLLATNSVESLDAEVVEDNIVECHDTEALEKAADVEEREEVVSLYRDRLDELTDDTEASDADPEPDAEEGDDTDAPEEATDADESSPDPFGSAGSESAEEANAADQDEPEPDPDPEPEDSTPSDNTAIADGSGGSTSAGVSVRDIAPDALTVTEAANRDRRWTTIVWAEPGMGKSHFGMSGQSPVCVIDTEGKADELAHKFNDSGQYDDPFIWQPSDFDGAIEALEQALSLLDAFREQEGVVGTIVVDSMSVMWGWSQQKYVEKFYPHADDVSEVELSTGFGSGKSDWKQIKNYHNVQFRQRMIDSPYHLVWTAMSEDDYDAQINEGRRDAEKPAGEKENVYKVDEVIRLREGSDGAPIGELQKSGKIKHRYTGLRYPTFPKHKRIVEEIDEAEAGDKSIASVEAKFDVDIVEGNPAYAKDDDE